MASLFVPTRESESFPRPTSSSALLSSPSEAHRSTPAETGEYAGEILPAATASERRERADRSGARNYYIMSVVEHTPAGARLVTTIDPSGRGNVAKYLQHSCRPNLTSRCVRSCSFVPRLAFFCARAIAAGEVRYAVLSNLGRPLSTLACLSRASPPSSLSTLSLTASP